MPEVETWGCPLRSLNKVLPIWFVYLTLEYQYCFWYSRSPREHESSVVVPLPCESGDWIELDASEGTSSRYQPRLAQRLETWKAEESQYNRGYYKLYIDSQHRQIRAPTLISWWDVWIHYSQRYQYVFSWRIAFSRTGGGSGIGAKSSKPLPM